MSSIFLPYYYHMQWVYGLMSNDIIVSSECTPDYAH